MNETATVFLSLETGNPPLRRDRAYAVEFMQQLDGLPEPIKARIPTLYERSGIDFRYSCVADYGAKPDDFEFFPRNWALSPEPSTGTRNRLYREQVVPLVEDVARRALAASGCSADDITHVIGVSCTGSFTPGIDIELVKRLGLPPTTRRTMIGFMGCYAAFNGLRAADAFCRSHPNARVLLVCAELCTIHFRVGETLEDAVVNSLFSDGAAACVLAAKPRADSVGELAFAGSASVLDDDSLDYMTWDIGDVGFMMGLSARVPAVVGRHAPTLVDALLSSRPGAGDLARQDIDFWAVHPGGRAIVERTAEALGLTDADVFDSLEVLRMHGNMSSPTILFVLKRFFDRHHARRAGGQDGIGLGVAMGFGPGLTLEGCLIEAVA